MEPDYKILWDTPENIQKWLNQWKHQYYLDTIDVIEADHERRLLVVLVIRTQKPLKAVVSTAPVDDVDEDIPF